MIYLEQLIFLHEGTFGRTYVTSCGVTRHAREPVGPFLLDPSMLLKINIDEPELASITQRYCECLEFPVSFESVWVLTESERIHFGLSVAPLRATFGSLRLDDSQRASVLRDYFP
jgi:Coenzyme Q (ubiquinone) biosynthesis protein Coq4